MKQHSLLKLAPAVRNSKSKRIPNTEYWIRGLARQIAGTFSDGRNTHFGFPNSGFFRIGRIRNSEFGLKRISPILAGLGLLCATSRLLAQNTYTISSPTADAFLTAANPNTNYGSAGSLLIAPASSAKGEFDSVLLFNTASAVSQFNSTYGVGNWTIATLTLSLASNFGIQGEQPNNALFNTINVGSFGIDWLSNNTWTEGTGSGTGTPGFPGNSMVTFDAIRSLMSGTVDPLGIFAYTPPGNNNNVYLNYVLSLDPNLVSGAAAGGNISLYFFAADNQVSYLFDSRNNSTGHPELTLTVEPTPEPATAALLAVSLSGFLFRRWRPVKP